MNQPRKALGHIYGLAVRFSAPSPPDNAPLLVGEGIETALSLLTAIPGIHAAATLSAGSLASFTLPYNLTRLVILELRGIGLLTGEAGSGKTTACRQLLSGLHAGLYRVFYVSLSTGHVMDMYKSIAWELGLSTVHNRANAYHVIRAEITRLCVELKQRPLLVFDEAHHLRNDVLEDLRLLTLYDIEAENRLCLLLVGLSELRRRLSMAVHEAFNQRIVVRFHLAGLEREELSQYLEHRLRLAGCELPLFENPVVEALFQATHGLPRKINRLAHYALTAAALDKAQSVTPEHLHAALEELSP